MAKQRSPNYPKHTLEEACRKVEKVYKVEHTHAAAREVIAKDLGYTSLNGASLTMIGTLNSYGLLEAEGDALKVSDDAVTILELPEGNPERVAAMRRRAFAPKLFEELRSLYGDNLPSDVNLRHFLIKKKFLPKAADEAIRVYRENLELVSAEGGDYNAGEESEGAEQPPSGGMSMQQPPATGQPAFRSPSREEAARLFASKTAAELAVLGYPPPPTGGSAKKELHLNLSRDIEARIVFMGAGEVTQEAIDKLKVLLEHSKDTFPTKAELEQPKPKRPEPMPASRTVPDDLAEQFKDE